MKVTLDTTVLIKGIIPPRRRKMDSILEQQLRLHQKAGSIFGAVESGKDALYIPSVGLVEVAAVAARLTGKTDYGIQACDYVRAHGTIVYDSLILEDAISIGAKTRISGFDSVFIACAKATDSTLITDDKGMHEAASKAGIDSRLLREI
ncbi:MAG: type II toxin-antitoxin system VapC family toxin [Candidatus Altiarchaeota archaeon]